MTEIHQIHKKPRKTKVKPFPERNIIETRQGRIIDFTAVHTEVPVTYHRRKRDKHRVENIFIVKRAAKDGENHG